MEKRAALAVNNRRRSPRTTGEGNDKDTRQPLFDVYTRHWLAFSSLSVPGPVRSLHPSGLALAISTFPIQLATWRLRGFLSSCAFARVRMGLCNASHVARAASQYKDGTAVAGNSSE